MNKCVFCKQGFIRKWENHKFCSIRCSNRFNLNNKNKPEIPQRYNQNLSELFGILLGDGSVTKYFAKIYLNRTADKGYEEYVAKLCKKLFGNKVVTLRDVPKEGTNQIQISSKSVCDYLRNIGFDPKVRNIPTWITKNDNFRKFCVRG